MGEGVLTTPFPRLDGALHAGAVPLSDVAERFGTPLYVYNLEHVEARYRAIEQAFRDVDHLIAYSVKANGGLAILDRLGRLGAGADIVSVGELHRARRASIPPDRIVFAGVGKTEAEMREALAAGIYAFNVESRGELSRLDAVASALGVAAPFAVRVNPDLISPSPHEYTRTGHAETKFGVPVPETLELYRWARERPWLRARGIDVHIGSQILEVTPYSEALSLVLDVERTLREEGDELEFVDIGGGYGIPYDGEPRLVMEDLADVILPLVQSSGLRLILEPGRFIVGEAGVFLTRVEYVKRVGSKWFVIVDGGMSELIRPSHYDAIHVVDPVVSPGPRPVELVDVVGPICETGDFLARRRPLELPAPGELLAVYAAGAYGFTMASNYNARCRPAEALVEGDRVHLVRRRETVEDLVRGESIPWSGVGGQGATS